MIPVCPYCEQPAMLVTGKVVYSHRPDLADLMFWLCAPCDAYVGCHKKGSYVWENNVKIVSDGTLPLGRLADKELRKWKSATHTVFDAMWKQRGWRRVEGYRWLARQLKLNMSQCHIGLFDIETCKKAIEVAKAEMDRGQV